MWQAGLAGEKCGIGKLLFTNAEKPAIAGFSKVFRGLDR